MWDCSGDVTITCDSCRQAKVTAYGVGGFGEAAGIAQSSGWQMVTGEWWCPGCWADVNNIRVRIAE